MTFGLGNGYGMPMVGGMNPIMNNMSPMPLNAGMSNFMGGNINMPQYFKEKYGCADCFRERPYLQEYPKPITPIINSVESKSLFARIFMKMFKE